MLNRTWTLALGLSWLCGCSPGVINNPPDQTPPGVVSTTPLPGALDVSLDTPVTAVFTEAVAAATLSPTSFLLETGGAPVGASVTYDAPSRTASLTPLAALLPQTQYTATLTSDVTDLAGNRLPTPYVWTFTSALRDDTPPGVASTTPAPGALDVSLGTPVMAVFTEAVAAATLSPMSFHLETGGASVLASVTYDAPSRTASLTPLAALSPETQYTATLTSDVTDLAGNRLPTPYVWTFTTGTAGNLVLLQGPAFWIAGQWTRIMVETPSGCGELTVTHPQELTLLDRWPWQAGDTVQRFYFRAEQPLRTGEIVFRSGEHFLRLPVRVLSWAEVLTERFEREITDWESGPRTVTLPRLFPMQGSDEHKTGLSTLTPEELEEQRAAAQGVRDAALAAMATAEDLEEIFADLPDSAIPRAVYLNNPWYQQVPEPKQGCPICGEAVFEGRSPFYPWVLDPENRPYQLQCPECERWFPSNDFAAGDMTSGEFPDDGWSYFDQDGVPYSFVAYYVQEHYHGYDRPELFSRYYLATGDPRWGRATALVLFRIAEQYLNLALNINQRLGYTQGSLWSGRLPPQGTPPVGDARGFYMDSIWSIGRDRQYAEAMERIWDYLEGDDPVLVAFLQAHHHPEVQTMQDAREFIEVGYFRTVAQGVIDRVVDGNGPTELAMGLRVARFLNTPRAIEIAEHAFNTPYDGMRDYLPNATYKDGAGYESPGYNNAHYGGTVEIADLLTSLAALRPDQYAAANLPLLDADPRFRAMFDHNIHMSLVSRTYANVGDDGDLAYTDPLPIRVGAAMYEGYWVSAFERWPVDVDYARALWDAAANAPISYLRDPDLRAQVTATVQNEGPYAELPSQVLDGYKHVILRAGDGDDQRAAWLRYGVLSGHFHHDILTMGFEAMRRTLLPEQGYHRGEMFRTEWDMNWAIHYCGRIVGGSVDDGQQFSRHDATLRLFGEGGWARVATARERLYDDEPPPMLTQLVEPTLRERTLALVDLDGQHSYVFSLFRLGGGTDHYLSFHGPRGTAQPSGLALVAQPTGTLAGPDVPYGQTWDSEWGSQNQPLLTFSFLDQVERASPAAPWTMDWSLENHPTVHLRLHGLGPAGSEVALAKGRPPGGGDPFELQWVMRHAQGPEPLQTQFVEVLEAYEGAPLLTEVRSVVVTGVVAGAQPAVAVEVIAGDRVDTLIHCPDPAATVTTATGITLQGVFGIWSEESGQFRRALLVEGTRIAKGGLEHTAPARGWSGQVVSTDYPLRRIVVAPAPADPQALIGRQARITNPGGHDVTHLITEAALVGGGVELTLADDSRIGAGPIAEIHDDGLETLARLRFEALYYKGKTLCDEGNTVAYRTAGVREARVYIDPQAHPGVNQATLAAQFVDANGDGVPRFTIHDYGPGDTVTVSSLISVAP
jgi:hypothetical protein